MARRVERITDRRYSFDRDKTTDAVEAMASKRIMKFPGMNQVDFPKRKVDVSNLVKCERDVHMSVKERIPAEDVDSCTEVCDALITG